MRAPGREMSRRTTGGGRRPAPMVRRRVPARVARWRRARRPVCAVRGTRHTAAGFSGERVGPGRDGRCPTDPGCTGSTIRLRPAGRTRAGASAGSSRMVSTPGHRAPARAASVAGSAGGRTVPRRFCRLRARRPTHPGHTWEAPSPSSDGVSGMAATGPAERCYMGARGRGFGGRGGGMARTKQTASVAVCLPASHLSRRFTPPRRLAPAPLSKPLECLIYNIWHGHCN